MTPNDSLQTGRISAYSSVELHGHGSGIFSIRISEIDGGNTLSRDLTAQLMKTIDTVRNTASAKVLIFEGTQNGFARGGRAHYNDALAQELYQSIASFPYPVIAAMQGDAAGAGFMLGALCDFMVCSETASYRYTDPEEGLFPTAEEDRLFSKRFGQVRAADFLYRATTATGMQLKEKHWSCPILPGDQVVSYALALASNLAKKSQDSLRLLKQHLARHMLDLANALTPVTPSPDDLPGGAKISASSKHLQLETHAEKVLVLRIRNIKIKKKYETKALVADLAALFAQLRDHSAYRAIVLLSEYPDFLPDAETKVPAETILRLQRVLLQSPLPVIAAMNPSAAGKAWFVSQFCDAAVYQHDGRYSAASLLQIPELAGLAASIFSHRFGNDAARGILLTGASHSGAELRGHAGPVAVAPHDQALAEALKLAESWAKWPSTAVLSWKKRTALSIQEEIDRVPADLASEAEPEANPIQASTPIALASKVIAATAHPEGIVEVTMQDRESKNMFSEEFIQGMNEVFAHIDATPEYKVVILSGYDKYFASGGTKEALVAIQQGKLKFTEDQTFKLALACKIPVIAAMQGHGIGAGLSLGLFADLPLLSEESKYVSPYMGYGFTPGVGATLIVPERMGLDLARDSLLTAQEHDGGELKDRGVPLPVYSRKQLHDAAMQLAKSIARNSRSSLILIKNHLNRHIHDRLEETCERELAMHELTFVGQSETLKQIQTVFDRHESMPKTGPVENAVSTSAIAQPGNVVVTDRASNNLALPEVTYTLKRLLAQELHLEEHEVDENTQYTDLGLDSITGVTWIRKVNEQYGLSLDATIVYSYSTLTKLGRHVKEQVENRDTLSSVPNFAELEAGKLGHSEPERSKSVTAAVSLDLIDLPSPSPVRAADMLPEVVASLKRLLSRELHVEEHEIDENTQYTDLGLDSITGVTWIRKVNEKYGLSLDATIVYSYSTLTKLGRHVKEQVENRDTRSSVPDLAELEAGKLGHREPERSKPVTAAVSLDLIDSPTPAPAPVRAMDMLPEVIANLKRLLSRELHVEEHEVDENTQYTDLGLDSITGVTWIRKVNEKYGLSLDATIVYSYPTLTKLGRHVKELAEKRDSTFSMPDLAELETRKLGYKGPENPAFVHSVSLAQVNEPSNELSNEPSPVRELVSWRKQRPASVSTSTEAPSTRSVSTSTEASSTRSVSTGTETPSARSVDTSAETPSTRSDSMSTETSVTRSDASQPIAVIGMAGQFPKAKNLEEYWQNLAGGKNCISEIPPNRWDLDAYFQEGEPVEGKANSKWLGLLDEFDLFDPLFFNISPGEATLMDPQQRVFLQACWHSIEHAGYDPKSLAGSQCGVFVGVGVNDYGLLSPEAQLSAQGFTGNASSILSARISYFLDLQGPCLSIDTACSSSLVAIAAACDSLVSGISNLALAGGVYVAAGPAMHIMTSQAGMLSTDGTCYTFDQRANGFVPGEASGVVVLKRLADAERDGDIIHAVIQGWGVNQDGRTNGITAPNPESQARLMQQVYERYKINPSGIQLIEAHGTGTKLGDPIEIVGLKTAFKLFTDKRDYCALGSVKSNIGHCLAAAGVAGVIKLVLALKHKQLPPTVNFTQLNEHIQLKGSPFYVNDSLRSWSVADHETRRGAVSAFGFSGTNAHIVIAEHVPALEVKSEVSVLRQDDKIMVPLSARTEEQLRQKSRDLLGFIHKHQGALDLIEVAYTLQIGREPMGERIGFLVSSLDALTAKLEAYLAGERGIADVYQGRVKDSKDEMKLFSQEDDVRTTVVNKWLEQRRLSKLLDWWVKGLAIDWNLLYGEAKPRRIELPIYPFAKERYWVEVATADGEIHPELIHPLLHRNTSVLSQQRYHSSFSGDEWFLDHKINGARALPALSLMEMVRAAVVDATSDQGQPAAIELSQIVWGQPLFVNETTEAEIALFTNDDDSVGFEVTTEGDNNGDPVKVIHAQGLACFTENGLAAQLDITSAKNQMSADRFEPEAFYAAAGKTGIRFGKPLQGLTAIYRGNDCLLANISVPHMPNSGQAEYMLHPAVVESALQACRSFIGGSAPLLLPAAMDSMTILSSCEAEMVGLVHYSQDSRKIDISLCNSAGNACVIINGLELSSGDDSALVSADEQVDTQAEEQLWDQSSYTYRWEERLDPVRNLPGAHKTVLIVHSDSAGQFEDTIREHYEQNNDCKIALIRLAGETRQVSDSEWLCGIQDVNGFQTALQGLPAIDALYFLASADEGDEIQLLRLVKYLKKNNKIDGGIDTYILTIDNYYLNGQIGNCQGAGAAGLAYSLAQGNYQFRVRNIDLASKDLKTLRNREDLFTVISREPSSDRGELIKIESGKRYRKTFFKLNWGSSSPSVIKQDGVYIIAGGSGIVGQVLTRSLIQRYQANVVWLGTRAKDSPKLQATLQTFEEFGEKLLYVQADVLSLESMRQAVDIIKDKYGEIHGAVFSAMVYGVDNSIDQITEEEFRSVVEVKTLGSSVFYEALGNEPLDFMCYFSSGQAYSFSGATKVAAYAAGISFADSFVRSVQKTSAFPVGTINWGAWEVFIRERLENAQNVLAKNMDALADEEAVGCFERFVGALQQGTLHQVLCMRASEEVQSLMNCNQEELVTLTGEQSPVALSLDNCIEIPRETITRLKDGKANSMLDGWIVQLMFYQLNRLVERAGQSTPKTVAEFMKKCGILDKYHLWVEESLNMLAAKNCIQLRDGVIHEWNAQTAKEKSQEWELQKQVFCQDESTRALIILVTDCLDSLPDILQGKTAATDVIFPNSSMEKVAGLYKNNEIADTFNFIVANAVFAYLQKRLELDPKARLRILEIGAGTGGTSAAIFSKLSPFKHAVEEYCYTDLSKAFFFHAEEQYIPENPYIVCRRLDVEQPIAAQGIEIGTYDLVVATNVLHATRNMRQTLRNSKAALHKNGFILLNEMSDKSLYTHLTVALLDGWWIFEDPELRIPGCPGLFPESWQRVLEEEGFSPVLFPAEDAHMLGNQIIVAQSDGVVRQKESPTQLKPAHGQAAVSRKESPTQPKPQQGDAAVRPKESPTRLKLAQGDGVVRQKESPVQLKPVTQAPPAPAAQKRVQPPAVSASKHTQSAILDCLSSALKIPADSIEMDIAFSDYGADSIVGANFVKQLNERLGISLNTAVIFEHSTVDRLAKHIMEVFGAQIQTQIQGQQESPGQQESQPAPEPVFHQVAKPVVSGRRVLRSRSKDDSAPEEPKARNVEIAIIGMSGRFPKAENVDEFWNNLVQGVDGVDELPAHYLDQKYYSASKQKGKTRCKWGGILADRDCFDPLFFNLSPREAESMNPHQRMVMQEGWNAIEDAGYNPRKLAGSQTGIFIGSEPTGYLGETFTGLSDAIIASRLSYILNLNGPAFVVNTGCSASGVAIHLACESLRNRETDLALAGGVNACMSKDTQVRLDEIDMLAPSGRCYTFDEAGDGTIISEAVGVLVLKRLDDAIASGDHIYGTIVGSGINQDGASNGITAPNGAAQEMLIRSVYDKFGINPEEISYVEAHGTGTKLGDPIEANALVRAFRKYTDKRGYCAVGSAKSHIGHAAAAAGATGVIKVLLSMRHKQLPKLLNFKTMNPLIEFDQSPFFIQTETAKWMPPGNAPRMAALNSFGHSGTNVHMVIKEYAPPGNAQQKPSGSHGNDELIIPLSAKTKEQLQQKCQALLKFINSSSASVSLTSMAYTLQLGREPMEERLGFVVSSQDELAAKLQAYVDGRKIEGFYEGRAKRNSEIVDSSTLSQLIAARNLVRLLELWTRGLSLDWDLLWDGQFKPERISLPGYPFARERYWISRLLWDGASESESHSETARSLASIENILDGIDDDSLAASEGIKLLKLVV